MKKISVKDSGKQGGTGRPDTCGTDEHVNDSSAFICHRQRPRIALCFTDGDMKMSYRINIVWDEEAAVWIATSQDVPGLVLESGSFDALLERVRFAVPELLELNGVGR